MVECFVVGKVRSSPKKIIKLTFLTKLTQLLEEQVDSWWLELSVDTKRLLERLIKSGGVAALLSNKTVGHQIMTDTCFVWSMTEDEQASTPFSWAQYFCLWDKRPTDNSQQRAVTATDD